LDKIIISQEANNNEEFFYQLMNSFDKIEESIKEVDDWRLLVDIINAFDE
jgi:hypothetical protein